MRLLAIILGSAAAILIVVVLTLPWWLGLAAASIGPRYGLRIEGYERVGYGRFRVEQATFERNAVRVHVERAEGDTPLLWLWRRATGEIGPVRAGAWSVEVTRSEQRPRDPDRPRGWVPLRGRLQRIADHLAEWIPVAEVGPGRVQWPNGALTFTSVSWRERVLRSPEIGYRELQAAAEVTIPADEPWRAEVRTTTHDASARLRSEAARVDGEVVWVGQRAPIELEFAAEGWMPATATATAQDWTIPAARVRLGQHYTTVHGGGRVAWREGRWTADVAVESEPRDGSPAPPLSVKVRGHGDRTELVAEALELTLPGANATLTSPVTIDRSGRLRSEGSTFGFTVDLSRWPWFEARGTLAGEGRVRANEAGFAAIDFGWRGEGLAVAGTDWRSAAAQGVFVWPEIELREGRLVSADGDELRWSGGWNFRTREVSSARVNGRIRSASLGRWRPAQPGFEAVEIDARAAGPWQTLAHEGRANVTGVRASRLREFDAELQWSGQRDELEEFAVAARAGATTVHVAGSADRTRVRLAELRLRNGTHERLALRRPTTIRWSPALSVEPLQLAGPNGVLEVELTPGEEYQFAATLRGVESEWLRELADLPKARWTLENFTAGARWRSGPAQFAAEGLLTLRLGEGRAAQLSTRLTGDADGVEVEALRVGEGAADIVNVTGQLPVVVQPRSRPFVQVDPRAAFALNAMTTPNPELWEQLAELIGIEIVEPEARARLSGTLEEPRGEARFRARRLAPLPDRFGGKWPKIEELDFYLIGEENGVRLDRFRVAVDQQPVRASGWLPFEATQWREFVRDPRRFMERGEFRLEVPEAEVAAIATYFPTYLAPKGRAQLEVTMNGREGLSGFVRLRDAMLRPLGPLGVVQEINADVRLQGRSAVVEAVTGRIGGHLVTLRGRAELPEAGAPQLDFSLRGENLPFVRRAGLLVRGDLDLTLKTPQGSTPLLGGTVRLRDSLFLSDVRALIPSGTKSAESRPPYFAIETPPLNDWRLDVRVEGERFMRLRTPVFNGTATARFRLGGTLGEPQATGEAIVDEGSIRLPFASFAVRQGQVRLTAEQPQPQVWVTAATRRYGYDLRLEITGAASSPNLTFTSSPPLEAEQVLLLVMAGQPPNDEIATTDRQRAARFGAFFGQSLLGSLSGDPESVERLTISSGENVSEQGRETYNIEYRLNDRWSLTGEYDEFDDYYGGVKWRFYQKGGTTQNGE